MVCETMVALRVTYSCRKSTALGSSVSATDSNVRPARSVVFVDSGPRSRKMVPGNHPISLVKNK